MYHRSSELLHASDSVMLVIDVQEKLMPHIANGDAVISNLVRLLQAAHVLEVPVVATEQYPKGLGPTEGKIAEQLKTPCFEKMTFSCMGEESTRNHLAELGRPKVLLGGVESHVCVQQTAFDLMAEGYRVFVAEDAVSSRKVSDHQCALRRMESSGTVVTTSEACLFEWCERAGTDAFQVIRRLI